MSQGDYFKGISLRYLLLHPAVWLILATAAMIFAATHLWDKHRYQIAPPGRYTISRENVDINPPPNWYRRDLYNVLNNQVFNSSTLLDQHVVPQTASCLLSIPWVQSVKNINKNPNGLSIRLNYRIPVAFVRNQDRTRTIVDSQGVVFNSQLLSVLENNQMENDLLRISMPRVDISRLQPWQTSSDERIEQAANLCGYIHKQETDLQLFRVVTFDLPSRQNDPEFQIWTRNGVRVLWGSAPGHEIGNEAGKSEKLKAIQAFITHHGPLESFQGKGEQMIDVRSGVPQLVAVKRFAESADILDSLK